MRSNKKHSLPPLCQAGILRRLDKKINSLIKMELRPCCSSSSCWVAEVSGATAIRWANKIEANKLQKIGKLILWLDSFFSLSGSKCIYSSLSGQWCNVRRHGAKLYYHASSVSPLHLISSSVSGKSLLRCHIIENCSFIETLFLLFVSVSTVTLNVFPCVSFSYSH